PRRSMTIPTPGWAAAEPASASQPINRIPRCRACICASSHYPATNVGFQPRACQREPRLGVELGAKEEHAMKKRLPKKLELSRETLRSLAEIRMSGVAGGFSKPTCPVICGSDA